MKLSAIYRPGLWCLGLMATAGVGIGAVAAHARDWIHWHVNEATGTESLAPSATFAADMQAIFDAAGGPLGRTWAGIESNPGPWVLAVVTFLFTVIYHRVVHGKTLRQAIDAATVRTPHVVHVVPPANSPAVAKAKARALRVQLVADQIKAENRLRELTRTGTGRDEGEIKRAEGNASHTQQALADARRLVAEKEQAHAEAAGKLASLNAERVKLAREVEEIGMALVVVGAQV